MNQLNYALIQAGWDNIFHDFTSYIDVIYENWFELFSSIVDRYIPKPLSCALHAPAYLCHAPCWKCMECFEHFSTSGCFCYMVQEI